MTGRSGVDDDRIYTRKHSKWYLKSCLLLFVQRRMGGLNRWVGLHCLSIGTSSSLFGPQTFPTEIRGKVSHRRTSSVSGCCTHKKEERKKKKTLTQDKPSETWTILVLYVGYCFCHFSTKHVVIYSILYYLFISMCVCVGGCVSEKSRKTKYTAHTTLNIVTWKKISI